MMKVFVSIKLRCVIGKFDTMLWGLMRRAFTLLFIFIIIIITIRSGRLCDVVAADMDRLRVR